MFGKILIANRGEIACRVIATARRLGIATVAVYSDADRGARHVELADEAWRIGPAPPAQSYLRGEALLDVGRRSGADAVHPGYGFLAENDAFAAACAAAGLTFVGPPPEAIRAMGSKSAAKALMVAASVPVVPGYHGDEQDDPRLAAEAEAIGYPLLIKASAGGGGKGMRLVRAPAELRPALASCRREALGAFGDGRVLLERWLERPRHVEVQVFADRHGHYLHLGERDCSVQRRHQKVLEEAPAPGLDAGRRRAMGATAVSAARAVGYVGAGTVEMIVDGDGSFYFMEMNTRLQVEHPVTEMVTGLDLVEWQLRVAWGEPLPLAQDQVPATGHAIEARIFAEDPERGFLPSTGVVRHLATPAESAHVRIDSGVRQGDEISPHYDPLIAKLIVHDRDREAARRRLAAALDRFEVAGPATNVAFLRRLVASAPYRAGAVDTGLVDRHSDELFPPPRPASDEALALAALAEVRRHEAEARGHAAGSADPWSPWRECDGWRLNQDNHHVLVFKEGERQVAVTVHYRPGGYELDLPHGRRRLHGHLDGERARAWLDDRAIAARVVRSGATVDVFQGGEHHTLVLHDPLLHEVDAGADGGGLKAPMPGKVVAVLVEPGAAVEKGTPLVILDAMKMEHTILAPAAGVVREVLHRVGDQVSEGAELLAFEARP
jgi:3-methylcrotonyl-CoA carboxylase alpha subunit